MYPRIVTAMQVIEEDLEDSVFCGPFDPDDNWEAHALAAWGITDEPAATSGSELPADDTGAHQQACFRTTTAACDAHHTRYSNMIAPPGPSSNAKRVHKYICLFEVGLKDDDQFCLVKRILGKSGLNMRRITEQTCAKVRLRGHASGFLEGSDHKEADIPLQINVSCTDFHDYTSAVQGVGILLEDLYRHYRRFCRSKDMRCPDLQVNMREIRRDDLGINWLESKVQCNGLQRSSPQIPEEEGNSGACNQASRAKSVVDCVSGIGQPAGREGHDMVSRALHWADYHLHLRHWISAEYVSKQGKLSSCTPQYVQEYTESSGKDEPASKLLPSDVTHWLASKTASPHPGLNSDTSMDWTSCVELPPAPAWEHDVQTRTFSEGTQVCSEQLLLHIKAFLESGPQELGTVAAKFGAAFNEVVRSSPNTPYRAQKRKDGSFLKWLLQEGFYVGSLPDGRRAYVTIRELAAELQDIVKPKVPSRRKRGKKHRKSRLKRSLMELVADLHVPQVPATSPQRTGSCKFTLDGQSPSQCGTGHQKTLSPNSIITW